MVIDGQNVFSTPFLNIAWLSTAEPHFRKISLVFWKDATHVGNLDPACLPQHIIHLKPLWLLEAGRR